MFKKFLNSVSPLYETLFFLLISVLLSIVIGLTIEFDFINKDTNIHSSIELIINFLVSTKVFILETLLFIAGAGVAYYIRKMKLFYLIGRKIAYSLFFLGLIPVIYSILMFWHPSIFSFTNSALTASLLTFVYGYFVLVFMQKLEHT